MSETRGRGLLYVTKPMHEHLGSPTTTDAWHKALLLPDTYEVAQVNVPDAPHVRYRLAILTDDISLDDSSLVVIEPDYYREDDKPALKAIKINKWDGKAWQIVRIEKA